MDVRSNYKEIDVYADGSCLLYSLVFSVLLPALNNNVLFEESLQKLFGDTSDKDRIKSLLQKYDGSKEFIHAQAKFLEDKIETIFRQRLVHFMHNHKEIYAPHTEGDVNFDDAMRAMSQPKTEGSEQEIRAASDMLGINIHVYKKSPDNTLGIYRSYPEQETKNRNIHIIHDQLSESSKEANHYRYWIDGIHLPYLPHIRIARTIKEILSRYENNFPSRNDTTTFEATLRTHLSQYENGSIPITDIYNAIVSQLKLLVNKSNTDEAKEYQKCLLDIIPYIAEKQGAEPDILKKIKEIKDSLDGWFSYKKLAPEHLDFFENTLATYFATSTKKTTTPSNSNTEETTSGDEIPNDIQKLYSTQKPSAAVEDVTVSNIFSDIYSGDLPEISSSSTTPTPPSSPMAATATTKISEQERIARKFLGAEINDKLNTFRQRFTKDIHHPLSKAAYALVNNTLSYYNNRHRLISKDELLNYFREALRTISPTNNQSRSGSPLDTLLAIITPTQDNDTQDKKDTGDFIALLSQIIEHIEKYNPDLVQVQQTKIEQPSLPINVPSKKIALQPFYDSHDAQLAIPIMSAEKINQRRKINNQISIINNQVVSPDIQAITCMHHDDNQLIKNIIANLDENSKKIKKFKEFNLQPLTDFGIGYNDKNTDNIGTLVHNVFKLENDLQLIEKNKRIEFKEQTNPAAQKQIASEIKNIAIFRQHIRNLLRHYKDQPSAKVAGLGHASFTLAVRSLSSKPEVQNSRQQLQSVRNSYLDLAITTEEDSNEQKRLRVIQDLFSGVTNYVHDRQSSRFSGFNPNRLEQIHDLLLIAGKYIDEGKIGKDEITITTLIAHLTQLQKNIDGEFIFNNNSELYKIVTKALTSLKSIDNNKLPTHNGNEKLIEQFDNLLDSACHYASTNKPRKNTRKQANVIKEEDAIAIEIKKQRANAIKGENAIAIEIREQRANAIKIVENYRDKSAFHSRLVKTLEKKLLRCNDNDTELSNLLQSELIDKFESVLADKTEFYKIITPSFNTIFKKFLKKKNHHVVKNKHSQEVSNLLYFENIVTLDKAMLEIQALPFIKNTTENSATEKNKLVEQFLELQTNAIIKKTCAYLLEIKEVSASDIADFNAVIRHPTARRLSITTFRGKDYPTNVDPTIPIKEVYEHYLRLLSRSKSIDLLNQQQATVIQHCNDLVNYSRTTSLLQNVRNRHAYLLLGEGTHSLESIDETLEKYTRIDESICEAYDNVLKDFCGNDKQGNRSRPPTNHPLLYLSENTAADVNTIVSKVKTLLLFYKKHIQALFTSSDEHQVKALTSSKNQTELLLSSYFSYLFKTNIPGIISSQIDLLKAMGFEKELHLKIENKLLAPFYSQLLAKCEKNQVYTTLAKYYHEINLRLTNPNTDLDAIFPMDPEEDATLDSLFQDNDGAFEQYRDYIGDSHHRNAIIEEYKKLAIPNSMNDDPKWRELFYKHIQILIESARSNSNEQHALSRRLQTIAYLYCGPDEQAFYEAAIAKKKNLSDYVVAKEPSIFAASISADANLKINEWLAKSLDNTIISLVKANDSIGLIILINLPDNPETGFFHAHVMATICTIICEPKLATPGLTLRLAKNESFIRYVCAQEEITDPTLLTIVNQFIASREAERIKQQCDLLLAKDPLLGSNIQEFNTIINLLTTGVSEVVFEKQHFEIKIDLVTREIINRVYNHYLSLLSKSDSVNVLDAAKIMDITYNETFPCNNALLKDIANRHLYLLLGEGHHPIEIIHNTVATYRDAIGDISETYSNVLNEFSIVPQLNNVNKITTKARTLLAFYKQCGVKFPDELVNQIQNFLSIYLSFLMKDHSNTIVLGEIQCLKSMGFEAELVAANIDVKYRPLFNSLLLACYYHSIYLSLAKYNPNKITLDTLFRNIEGYPFYTGNNPTITKTAHTTLTKQISTEHNVDALNQLSDKWREFFSSQMQVLFNSVLSHSEEQNLVRSRLHTIAYYYCGLKEQAFYTAAMATRDHLFNYVTNKPLSLAVGNSLSPEDTNTINAWLKNGLDNTIASLVKANNIDSLNTIINLPDKPEIGFLHTNVIETIYNTIVTMTAENKNVTHLIEFISCNHDVVDFLCQQTKPINPRIITSVYKSTTDQQLKQRLFKKIVDDINHNLTVANSEQNLTAANNKQITLNDLLDDYDTLFTDAFFTKTSKYPNCEAADQRNQEAWNHLFDQSFSQYLGSNSIEMQRNLLKQMRFIAPLYCDAEKQATLKKTLDANNNIDKWISNNNPDINPIDLRDNFTNCDELHQQSAKDTLKELFNSAERQLNDIAKWYDSIKNGTNETISQPDHFAQTIKEITRLLVTAVKAYTYITNIANTNKIESIDNFLETVCARVRAIILPNLHPHSHFFCGSTKPDDSNNLNQQQRMVYEAYLLTHSVIYQACNPLSTDIDVGLKYIRSTYIAHNICAPRDDTYKFRLNAFEQFSCFSELFPSCSKLGLHTFHTNSRTDHTNSRADCRHKKGRYKPSNDFSSLCLKEYANENLFHRLIVTYYGWLLETQQKLLPEENTLANYITTQLEQLKKVFHDISQLSGEDKRIRLTRELYTLTDDFATQIKGNIKFATVAAELREFQTLTQTANKAYTQANGDEKLAKQYYIFILLSTSVNNLTLSRAMTLAYRELISLTEDKTVVFDARIIAGIAKLLYVKDVSENPSQTAVDIAAYLKNWIKHADNMNILRDTAASVNGDDPKCNLFRTIQDSLSEYLRDKKQKDSFVFPLPNLSNNGNTEIDTHITLLLNKRFPINAYYDIDLLPSKQIEDLQSKANTYPDSHVKDKYKICAFLYAHLQSMIDDLNSITSAPNNLEKSIKTIIHVLQVKYLLNYQLCYLQTNDIKSTVFTQCLEEKLKICQDTLLKVPVSVTDDLSSLQPEHCLLALNHKIDDLTICIKTSHAFSEPVADTLAEILGTYQFDEKFLKECLKVDWNSYSSQQQNVLFMMINDFLHLSSNTPSAHHYYFTKILRESYSETALQIAARLDLKRLLNLTLDLKDNSKVLSILSNELHVVARSNREQFFSLAANNPAIFLNVARYFLPFSTKELSQIELLLNKPDAETIVNFCALFNTIPHMQRKLSPIDINQSTRDRLIQSAAAFYESENGKMLIDGLSRQNNELARELLLLPYKKLSNIQYSDALVTAMIPFIEKDKYYFSVTEFIKLLDANRLASSDRIRFCGVLSACNRNDASLAELIIHELKYFCTMAHQRSCGAYNILIEHLASKLSQCKLKEQQQDFATIFNKINTTECDKGKLYKEVIISLGKMHPSKTSIQPIEMQQSSVYTMRTPFQN